MTNLLVTVWPHREIAGWNGDPNELPDLVACKVVPLAEALATAWPTDVHLWPGWVEGPHGPEPQSPRINIDALPTLAKMGAALRFGCVFVDADDPVAHATKTSARDVWRAGFAERVAALPDELQEGLGWYETRGGARLVWVLDEVVTDPADYIRILVGLRARLRAHGFERIDEFIDWGRSYRAPRVVRDGKTEARLVKVAALGDLPLSCADLRRAAPAIDEHSSPFDRIGHASLGFELPQVVEEGGRNQTAVRLAGSLRRSGLDEEEILLALQSAVTAGRFGEWVPDRGELERIARNIGRKPAGPAPVVSAPPKVFSNDSTTAPSSMPIEGSVFAADDDAVRFVSDSDVTLAIGLCEELEEGLGAPVIGCDGTVWRYESPRWRPMKAHELENHVAGWEGSPVVGFKGKPVPLRLSNAKIKAVVERAKVARAQPDFFQDTVGAVAFRNGMATLRGGEVVLEAPSPEHRVRHVLELDYTEAEPVHLFDLFRTCFEGADDSRERGLFLSEFVGACLTGVATRFEIAAILLGGGANGKSTFMNHVVRPIFPKTSITSVSPQDMSKEYNRATLVDSAINIVSEMPDGDILGAEAVKAIISGESVQARHIREAPFDLTCKAGHLFAANDLPALRDFSMGFQRRWQIITWPNEFRESNPRRRTDWPELLAGERDAIASWFARCAAQALHRARYTEVPSSNQEVFRWVNEADSVAVWVESRCKRSTKPTPSAQLYGDYRAWTGGVGMRPVTIQKFGRRLTRLGHVSVHTMQGEAKELVISPQVGP